MSRHETSPVGAEDFSSVPTGLFHSPLTTSTRLATSRLNLPDLGRLVEASKCNIPSTDSHQLLFPLEIQTPQLLLLPLDHLEIKPTFSHELFMRADFAQAARFQGDDQIRVRDRAQTMGDDKRRAAAE